ncbi:unnamed protein product [Phytophthora fragariaefolia]|uniref:Unnamed protein product n=1 Tax=Phytophthora fragariaefolia TaxID=1490495 RepID=A0A9W6YP30_9STRA|nr:unnamed protein product [Phytophthora fragariaefolia]
MAPSVETPEFGGGSPSRSPRADVTEASIFNIDSDSSADLGPIIPSALHIRKGKRPAKPSANLRSSPPPPKKKRRCRRPSVDLKARSAARQAAFAAVDRSGTVQSAPVLSAPVSWIAVDDVLSFASGTSPGIEASVPVEIDDDASTNAGERVPRARNRGTSARSSQQRTQRTDAKASPQLQAQKPESKLPCRACYGPSFGDGIAVYDSNAVGGGQGRGHHVRVGVATGPLGLGRCGRAMAPQLARPTWCTPDAGENLKCPPEILLKPSILQYSFKTLTWAPGTAAWTVDVVDLDAQQSWQNGWVSVPAENPFNTTFAPCNPSAPLFIPQYKTREEVGAAVVVYTALKQAQATAPLIQEFADARAQAAADEPVAADSPSDALSARTLVPATDQADVHAELDANVSAQVGLDVLADLASTAEI